VNLVERRIKQLVAKAIGIGRARVRPSRPD
jgi:hypothetical protein